MRTTLRTLIHLATALLASMLIAAGATADSDGPYVIRNAAGALEAWSVEIAADGPHRDIKAVKAGATIAVPAVGTVPSFSTKIRPPALAAPDSVTTKRDTPLFIVADTHGEYEILVQMLRAQQVVDDRLAWKFGRGHLVILGDVFDRGAHQTEILWLIYELEAQAQQAGGGVHFVLGNHENMALRGDARYLNPKYRQTAAVLGVESYSALFGRDSVLGQWLRSKPVVIKVNDLLCLHGGISPQIVERKLSLADINGAVRLSWNETEPAPDERERIEFLLGPNGPLWYRGYFADSGAIPEVSGDDIGRLLKYFGVHEILVGHTRVPTITPLFDGRVLAVQVYPQRAVDGTVTFEALLVRGGKFLRALPDGRTEPLNL